MLNRWFSRIESRFLAFQRIKHWKFYLTLLCCLYCILSNTPGYTRLTRCSGQHDPIWETINKQVDHPLSPIVIENISYHEAKLAFRLVPPILAKILPSSDLCDRMIWLFLLQNIAGLIFIFLLIRLTEKNVSDRFLRILVPCCFCVLYTANSFFCDLTFFFDSFAFLFLLISISYSNFFIICISLFLACFTDERALIACGFVLLYHLLRSPKESKITGSVIAPFVVIPVYLGARFYLQYHFGLHTPHGPGTGVGIREVLSKNSWDTISLGIFSAFKSFWLILLLGVFYLKGRIARIIYAGTLLCIVGVGISVYDFSRSISYGFIGILIILFEMHKKEVEPAGFNKFVFLLFITSMLNPILSVRGYNVDISNPVFVKYLNRFHKDEIPVK